MRLRLAALHLAKAGNSEEEYEDAYAPDGAPSSEWRDLRVAVADGATESMLSGPWARALCEAFLDVGEPAAGAKGLERVVAFAQRDFARWRKEYLAERASTGRDVQWFEEPGLEAGAFATFLGLEINDPLGEAGYWSAIAVGDCCVFHLRGARLLKAFPVATSEGFGNAPDLVASRAERNVGLELAARAVSGEYREGDRFVLATDAVAAWLLREHEEGRARWSDIAALTKDDVAAARDAKTMRNDDVTLVVLDLGGGAA